MEWCTAMRDIHCLWSISKHFLHAQQRSNMVYKAPTSHSLIPPCSFALISTLKLHTKYQILRHPLCTVSMGWCTTMRDIHCFWSISKPYLSTYNKRVKIGKAPNSPSSIILCHNYHTSLPTKLLKWPIWGPHSPWKWGDMGQGEGVHCFWCAAKSCLGVYVRGEELLESYASP